MKIKMINENEVCSRAEYGFVAAAHVGMGLIKKSFFLDYNFSSVSTQGSYYLQALALRPD